MAELKIRADVVTMTPPQLDIPGKPNLSAKQMYAAQAEYILTKSLDRAIWAYRNDAAEVVKIINYIQNELAFEGLATTQGMEDISSYVFGDGFVRDFINTVQVNFVTMFGDYHNAWSEFVSNIATGLTLSPVVRSESGTTGLSAVPNDIKSRMNSHRAVMEWLIANNWAVIVIMIKMWGTLNVATS